MKKLLNAIELIFCVILFVFPSLIQYIRKPSVNMCKVVAHRDINNLWYIKNPPDEFQFFIIKKNIRNASKLRRINFSVQMEIIDKVPWAIKYFNNPCLEAQMLSVTKDPSNIRYINFPSRMVQMAAVKRDPWVFKYINNPFDDVFYYTASIFMDKDKFNFHDGFVRTERRKSNEYKSRYNRAKFGVVVA